MDRDDKILLPGFIKFGQWKSFENDLFVTDLDQSQWIVEEESIFVQWHVILKY